MKISESSPSSSLVVLLIVCASYGVHSVPQHQEPTNELIAGRGFTCPEESGDFEDALQCDKYWRCEAGVATAKLCDDGLVFDILKADRADPCDSPYVVDCADRVELQEPTYSSEFCPRRHGFFADPDPAICDVFFTCKNGHHSRTPCSSGLHFDERSGTCTWPANAQRVGCGEPKAETINGFSCPAEEVINDQGMKNPHPSYPNLDDCQKFYVCLNGLTPQEASCNLGQVFNERSMLCDYPEKVVECNDWYKGDALFDVFYDDANADGLKDFGDRRDFSQTSIN